MLHTINEVGRAAQSHQFAMGPTTVTVASDAVTAVHHPRRDRIYALRHGLGPDDH